MLRNERIRWDRPASGPVVVSLGGQRSPASVATFRSVEIYGRIRYLYITGVTC
jgi:hypothetical protein